MFIHVTHFVRNGFTTKSEEDRWLGFKQSLLQVVLIPQVDLSIPPRLATTENTFSSFKVVRENPLPANDILKV